MTDKEFFIDDIVIIPSDIKNMTKEELQQAIDKFEEEKNKQRELVLSDKD